MQLEANQWYGGIGYISYYDSKNAVSPNSVNWTNTWGSGSIAAVNCGNSFTLGAAVSLSGTFILK